MKRPLKHKHRVGCLDLDPWVTPGAGEVASSEEVEEETHFLNEDTPTLPTEPGPCNLWLNSGAVAATPVSATQVGLSLNTRWKCAVDSDEEKGKKSHHVRA